MPHPRRQATGPRLAPPVAAPPQKPQRSTTIEQLFADEESPLLGFAHRFVRRREVAEELVQEAFLRTHKHWPQIENPRAWIYRATRNLCLTWIRDHARETEMDPEQNDAAPDPDAPRPDRATERIEAVGALRSLLAELPEADRELVRLKYTEDLRYKQIADRTGLSVSNVGYKLHHLLKNLATDMQSAGFDGAS